MLKADGQRTSESDRDFKQVLPHIYSQKSRMLTLKRGGKLLVLIFSFPMTLGCRTQAPHPIKQEDAATCRWESQEGPKSQPWTPARAPAPPLPWTHRCVGSATEMLHPGSQSSVQREIQAHRSASSAQNRRVCFVVLTVKRSIAGNTRPLQILII